MTESKKAILLSASAPWLAAALIVSICSILLMVGSDIGAGNERQRVANDCRASGAFTVKRTGFECGVKR